jgi:hypothetical protein
MARIVEAKFAHVANAESGWYVVVQGAREEVMGDVGMTLAEASAIEAGWDGKRAEAGPYPSGVNLREYSRHFWFYGESLWERQHGQCWCRHQFCGHRFAWSMPHPRCKAPEPYTLEGNERPTFGVAT